MRVNGPKVEGLLVGWVYLWPRRFVTIVLMFCSEFRDGLCCILCFLWWFFIHVIIYQLLIMFLLTKADPDLIRDGVLEIEHAGRLVQHTQRLLIAIVSSHKELWCWRFSCWHSIQYNTFRLLLSEGYEPDILYTSRLKRAVKSTWSILNTLNAPYLPVYKSWRLNERNCKFESFVWQSVLIRIILNRFMNVKIRRSIDWIEKDWCGEGVGRRSGSSMEK